MGGDSLCQSSHFAYCAMSLNLQYDLSVVLGLRCCSWPSQDLPCLALVCNNILMAGFHAQLSLNPSSLLMLFEFSHISIASLTIWSK
jgi:hypothetical protein